MTNNCATCKHWQGRKGKEWGDCYRVVAHLQPKLLLCYNQIDDDTKEYFKVPFDPHDVKYWVYNDRFMNLYNDVLYYKPNEFYEWLHVRRYVIKEEDMKYDQHGAERIAVVKLFFFETFNDYECSLWEEK